MSVSLNIYDNFFNYYFSFGLTKILNFEFENHLNISKIFTFYRYCLHEIFGSSDWHRRSKLYHHTIKAEIMVEFSNF